MATPHSWPCHFRSSSSTQGSQKRNISLKRNTVVILPISWRNFGDTKGSTASFCQNVGEFAPNVMGFTHLLFRQKYPTGPLIQDLKQFRKWIWIRQYIRLPKSFHTMSHCGDFFLKRSGPLRQIDVGSGGRTSIKMIFWLWSEHLTLSDVQTYWRIVIILLDDRLKKTFSIVNNYNILTWSHIVN
jgi:hypothetical protein